LELYHRNTIKTNKIIMAIKYEDDEEVDETVLDIEDAERLLY